MKLGIYSLFDKKVGAYLRPFYAQNDDVAQRTIVNAISQNQEFSSYPEDYQLCKLGTFVDDTGKLVNEENTVITELVPLHTEFKKRIEEQAALMQKTTLQNQ